MHQQVETLQSNDQAVYSTERSNDSKSIFLRYGKNQVRLPFVHTGKDVQRFMTLFKK